MTDTTQKLWAIIQKQQQIIEKMAQLQPAPQRLEPVSPEFHPEKVVFDHLAPAVKNALRTTMPIVQHGNTLKAFFKPGQASQAALNHITQVVQTLLKQNKLSFPYTVEALEG